MRLHRFFVESEVNLAHDFWLQDERIINQWNKVLRFRPEQEVVLFDGVKSEKLYKIIELTKTEAHLLLKTDMVRKITKKKIYLLWSILKKDKNDWILQKCTELGVSNFVPILADRTEKTGFDIGRAKKIIIEAAEQCGRSDIPSVREPSEIKSAIDGLSDSVALYVCEQDSGYNAINDTEIGVLIGPEGGWSDKEKKLFKSYSIKHINLHDNTLRAETAAVVAVTMVGL